MFCTGRWILYHCSPWEATDLMQIVCFTDKYDWLPCPATVSHNCYRIKWDDVSPLKTEGMTTYSVTLTQRMWTTGTNSGHIDPHDRRIGKSWLARWWGKHSCRRGKTREMLCPESNHVTRGPLFFETSWPKCILLFPSNTAFLDRKRN